jgi:hypothetical protein
MRHRRHLTHCHQRRVSVCNEETRFHLNGVFFESDGSKSRDGVD